MCLESENKNYEQFVKLFSKGLRRFVRPLVYFRDGGDDVDDVMPNTGLVFSLKFSDFDPAEILEMYTIGNPQ